MDEVEPVISMSSEHAPSQSTVYLSNIPFNLTNNDIHKLFDEYGKVVKYDLKKNLIYDVVLYLE